LGPYHGLYVLVETPKARAPISQNKDELDFFLTERHRTLKAVQS